MGNIKVLFGIDMETDIGSFTPYYNGVNEGTPLLLDLFKSEGIEATFYFTGDTVKECPKIAKLVAGSGNEVGCHSLYHETVGDELFPVPGMKPLLPEEVPLRLKKATEWVEEACGVRPVSFRCPRLWGSTAVINTLEKLGYATDASYPMFFYRKQFAPYHPSRENWLEKGDLKILEIPNFADMLMESGDPELGRDRDQWPMLRALGADGFMVHIENFLSFVREKNIPQVLCFYLHPWEFVPMPKQFHVGEGTSIPDPFIVENCGEAALGSLRELINRLRCIGAKFYKAKELADFDW